MIYIGGEPDGRNVICYNTVRAAIKRYKKTGLVEYPPPKDRTLTVTPELVEVLKRILSEEPYLYLPEIAAKFNEETDTPLPYQHIHRVLIAEGLSLKVFQQVRAARDEEQRAEYWGFIHKKGYPPWQLIFGDETSMDGRALLRRKGWSKVGSPLAIRDLYHRGVRISILTLDGYNGKLCFRYVQGAYTTLTPSWNTSWSSLTRS